jgi:hypothetical protein
MVLSILGLVRQNLWENFSHYKPEQLIKIFSVNRRRRYTALLGSNDMIYMLKNGAVTIQLKDPENDVETTLINARTWKRR